MKDNVTGRLKHSLSEIAQAIVNPEKSKEDLLKELNYWTILNEVHLITLFKAKLLSLDAIKKMFQEMNNLKEEQYAPLLNKVAERGIYYLYENYLINKLGIAVVGSLHIGRSRNDMNATLSKLILRESYKTVYYSLKRLRKTVLNKSKIYQNLAMPIYSQFQVAQVGTYAYYLLAIEEALAREQFFLRTLETSLNECPLGSAAGCGTSFPLEKEIMASLLGFSSSSNNALDAVASRDFPLRLLSSMSILATLLSRIGQDYQVWTTQEFNLFSLPDTVCGGSSMMPQKRNPYLLEIIKGKTTTVNGILVQALTAMHNVPFGNSVEVGTEALQGIEKALKNISDTLILLELIIDSAIPIKNQMEISIHRGMAFTTGMAEILVKKNQTSFREAHYDIGAKITSAIDKKQDPLTKIFELMNDQTLKKKNLNFWAHMNEYGGGPGEKSINISYNKAKKRLNNDIDWIKIQDEKWTLSNEQRQIEIKNIITLEKKSDL